MSNYGELSVYFACPHCHRVYTAKQERKLGRAHGCFRCGACRTPVHEWTGYHDFTDWRPTRLKTKSADTHQPFWKTPENSG